MQRLPLPRLEQSEALTKKEPRALNFQKRKNVGFGFRAVVGQQEVRAGAFPGELAQQLSRSSNSFTIVTTQARKQKIPPWTPPETNKRTEPGLVLLGARFTHHFPYISLHPELVVFSTLYALKGDKPQRQDVCRY